MQELGTTGLKRTSGFIYDEFLVRLQGIQGIKTYREMSDNDPVIGAVLYAIEKVITRLEWRVDPYKDQSQDGDPDDADVETAAFIESCLNDMSDSWDSTLSQILSMIIYGWSFHEIVYKRRVGPDQKDPTKRSKFSDGKIGWRKWAIRGQETLYLWTFDADGGIQGMQQVDPYTGHGRIDIPIEKALLFRTTTVKNNPEGRSLLRNAYRPWYFKKRIEEIEAVGIERDLAGLPVALVPPQLLSNAATSEERAALDAIKQIVRNVKRDEQEGIVFPLAYDPETGNPAYDLKLLSTGGRRQFDTDAIIGRYDQRIAMTVLADFLLLGHENVGSQALSVSKVDLFIRSLDAFLSEIAEVFNNHAIPRLMRLNGVDEAMSPTLTWSTPKSVDLASIGSFITSLAQAGAPLFPDENLEGYLRGIAGLPVGEAEGV